MKRKSKKIERNEWQIKLDTKLERNGQNKTKNVNKTTLCEKVKFDKSRQKKLERNRKRKKWKINYKNSVRGKGFAKEREREREWER